VEVELLLADGVLVDGSGSPRRRADVAIAGGDVVAIGDLTGVAAAVTIDVGGHIVCPGFIDPHAHVELALLSDGRSAERLRQGITAEILGQDGLSYAPLSPDRFREQVDYLAGLNGQLPSGCPPWTTWEDYFTRISPSLSQHVAFLAPYGAARVEVAGWADRPLTIPESAAAGRIVRDCLDRGALGVAVGLDYFPQSTSATSELDGLGRVVADYDAVLVAHVRGRALGMIAGVEGILSDYRAHAGAARRLARIHQDGQWPWHCTRCAAALPDRRARRGSDRDRHSPQGQRRTA